MMPIKGISTIYRPQRQGKIHLGVKKQTKEGKDYPSEVDFFVLKDAPELIPIYGEKPTSLNVTLPSARFEREDFDAYMEKVFPQYLKRYRKSGLMCKGDGETANAVTEKGIEEISCPCDFLDKGECKRTGVLRVRIQEIPSFNVYQITTSSFNSIVNINSFVRDLAEHCLVHRLDLSSVKLVLRRKETVTQRLEKGESKQSTHHVMILDLDPRFYKSLDDVRIRALPQGQAKPLELPPAEETVDPLDALPEAEVSDANEDAGADETDPESTEKEAENPMAKIHEDLSVAIAELKKYDCVVSASEQSQIDNARTESDLRKVIKHFYDRIEMVKRRTGKK